MRFLASWKPVLAAFLCAASLSAQVAAPGRVFGAIVDPDIALLLIVLGAFGIYAEFCSPGLIAPGVIGAIFLYLGVTSLSRLSINRAGASVMILGLIFCVLGARWPARGMLTASGALSLAFGAVTLIDAAAPRVHWRTALALAIPFALVTSFLLSVAIRARRNKAICA